MDEYLHNLFKDILICDFNIKDEDERKIIELGKDTEYGRMEIYPIFPGIFLSYVIMNVESMNAIFLEENIASRILEINHCSAGRYAYQVGDDKIIYFEKGICA